MGYWKSSCRGLEHMEHGMQIYAGLWYVDINRSKILLQIFSKDIVICCRFVAKHPDVRKLLKIFSRELFLSLPL